MTLLLGGGEGVVDVALLDADGRLVEFRREERDAEGLVGEVRKGVVKDVRPGMDAAFVDVGLGALAYLHASDARRFRPLESLRPGDEILVQVAKESHGTKGVRVTPNIALPGRLLVHLPFLDHVGVSHRIGAEAERESLRTLAEALRPVGSGWVARTAAAGASADEIAAEIEALASLWREIEARAAAASAPALVWRDIGPAGRAVRDLGAEAGRVVADSPVLADEARAAGAGIEIEVIEGDVLAAHGVPAMLEAALGRTFPLPSGGRLVLDETEAFAVIDVDTGRFVAAAPEETIRRVNLEAAEEVARLIRLRNLGGVVLVDFVDMASEDDRAEVLERLRASTARDPVRVHVVGWTALGIAEMTRKRVRRPLSQALQTSCPRCRGLGRVARGADIL